MSHPVVLLGRLRRDMSGRRLCARITFSDSTTLDIGTSQIVLDNGAVVFDPLLVDVTGLRQGIAYMQSPMTPASCQVEIAAGKSTRLGPIAALLVSKAWRCAEITVWLTVEGETSSSNLGQIFSGIVSTYAFDGQRVVMQCVQDRRWVGEVMRRVTSSEFPDAPDGSLSKMLPFVVGRMTPLEMRGVYGFAYDAYGGSPPTNKLGEWAYLNGARLALPGVIVNAGRGADAVRVAFAGHELKKLSTWGDGAHLHARGNESLNAVNSTKTEVNGADLAGYDVEDDLFHAWHGVRPTAVAQADNTATDARLAMDGNETTFAHLSVAANTKRLELFLPDAPSLGAQLDCGLLVAMTWRTNATTMPADSVRFYVNGTQVLSWPASPFTNTYTGTLLDHVPIYIRVDNISGQPQWSFYSDGATGDLTAWIQAGAPADLEIGIIGIGLYVDYQPSRNVATPAPAPGVKATYDVQGRDVSGQDVGPTNVFRVYGEPGQGELSGLGSDLWANVQGMPDDGSGTYTGTADALIERPSDVIRLVLALAGFSGSDIETAPGALGSFVDARGIMAAANGAPFEIAFACTEPTTTLEIVENVARQTCAALFLDRIDGKWKLVPWARDRAVTYPLTFGPEHVLSLAQDSIPDVEIITAVRVSHAYDESARTFLGQAHVSPDASGGGYDDRDYRDQRGILATGENDSIPFYDSTDRTATIGLAAGEHSPGDLASGAEAALIATGSSIDKRVCCFGWVASNCNKVYVTVGATNYTATLPTGYAGSPGGLMRSLVEQLEAAATGLTWEAEYESDATSADFGKVTLRASGVFTIRRSSALSGSAWPMLGFRHGSDLTGATEYTATDPHYFEHYHFMQHSSDLDLRWTRTAAGIATSRLFGWSGQEHASGRDLPSRFPRGAREATMEASADDDGIGRRREASFQLPWVRDPVTAGAIRDLLADALNADRIAVRFTTHAAPDLTVGDVIEFDPDLDATWPFMRQGSDGTWAGKRFVVLEVQQSGMPECLLSALCIEYRL